MTEKTVKDLIILLMEHVAEMQATHEVLLKTQASILAALSSGNSDKQFAELVKRAEQAALLHRAQLLIKINRLDLAGKKQRRTTRLKESALKQAEASASA